MSITSARTQRTIVRTVHIVVGLALGTYVYLPLHLEGARDGLRLLLMFVGIPLVVATGLWLWKGVALRRAMRRTAAPHSTAIE